MAFKTPSTLDPIPNLRRSSLCVASTFLSRKRTYHKVWSSLKLFCLNSAAVQARPFITCQYSCSYYPETTGKKKKTHHYASLHLPVRGIPNCQTPDSGKHLSVFLATLRVRGRIARAGGALSAFLLNLHSTLREEDTLLVQGNHWANER